MRSAGQGERDGNALTPTLHYSRLLPPRVVLFPTLALSSRPQTVPPPPPRGFHLAVLALVSLGHRIFLPLPASSIFSESARASAFPACCARLNCFTRARGSFFGNRADPGALTLKGDRLFPRAMNRSRVFGGKIAAFRSARNPSFFFPPRVGSVTDFPRAFPSIVSRISRHSSRFLALRRFHD
jgi:hypothetical protein